MLTSSLLKNHKSDRLLNSTYASCTYDFFDDTATVGTNTPFFFFRDL